MRRSRRARRPQGGDDAGAGRGYKGSAACWYRAREGQWGRKGTTKVGSRATAASNTRARRRRCDELDFATAEGPPSNFQAFRLKPSPVFGSFLLQFSFLPNGRRAGKLGSVTSSHAPERRLNVRFTSKRHALHL